MSIIGFWAPDDHLMFGVGVPQVNCSFPGGHSCDRRFRPFLSRVLLEVATPIYDHKSR